MISSLLAVVIVIPRMFEKLVLRELLKAFIKSSYRMLDRKLIDSIKEATSISFAILVFSYIATCMFHVLKDTAAEVALWFLGMSCILVAIIETKQHIKQRKDVSSNKRKGYRYNKDIQDR